MKRINNLYDKIASLENLRLADQKARKGKLRQAGVMQFDKNAENNLQNLRQLLLTKTYCTSRYETFTVFEPKERIVYRLPYFPDRIVHHAVMNVLEPIFTAVFTEDTYSCIKGKGIHAAQRNLRSALNDVAGTTYCLKLDIKKFYPSVDHQTLKNLLRRKFKDQDLLWLLDEIIDSADGIPIGNYLSQYFANFYLTYFDHWIKETKLVKYYFRYADDIVILSSSKLHLHELLAEIREYLDQQLCLTIKNNYQIFPVVSRGIDFVGYVFYHTHTRMRKTIKKRFAKALSKGCGQSTIAAYNGWLQSCDSTNLQTKLTKHEQFRRFQNRAEERKLRRRQKKDIESPEHGNNGTGVPDSSIEV